MPKHSVPYQTVGAQATKQRIIETAAKLFAQKGYNGTSVDDIATACEIQKPSIFHHFSSKRVIAVEAIKASYLICKQQVFNVVYQDQNDPNNNVKCFSQTLKQFLFTQPEYAFMGFLGVELIGEGEAFKVSIQHYFRAWFDAFERLLLPLYGGKKANEIARDSVAYIYGSLMLSRIFEKEDYLENIDKKLQCHWMK